MKKIHIVFIAWMGLTVLTNASASVIPEALSSDNHIKVVAYNPNQVVSVRLSPMVTTEFALNPDEKIIDVENGDAAVWVFDNKNAPPNVFFLKPTDPSDTNFTVITDKRTYYFHVYAAKDATQAGATYTVKFIYPEEEKEKMLREQASTLNLSKDPSVYNWNYSFNGSKTILPLHVFDDGNFTYMQLQQGQPVPAVFAVDNAQGEESVVNYRRQGNYLVIERIAPQFTLRDGKYDVVSIFNNTLTSKLWSSR